MGVPILTQSENWALLLCLIAARSLEMFQSSPSPKTGRYIIFIFIFVVIVMFQSSPSPKTGRYTVGLFDRPCHCSNPHPVRKLGAI